MSNPYESIKYLIPTACPTSNIIHSSRYYARSGKSGDLLQHAPLYFPNFVEPTIGTPTN